MKRNILKLLIGASILLISCNRTENAGKTGEVAEIAISETVTDSILTKTEGEDKMGTIKLTKADFLTKIHNYEKDMKTWKYLGDKPAVIDFYADWCGPCKQIAPILEELAVEYGDDIYIYKVDVDSEEELAAVFGIRSIPSMLFIPMEGEPQMATGAAPKTELKQTIDKVLLKK